MLNHILPGHPEKNPANNGADSCVDREKMKSVNVMVTRPILKKIDAMSKVSRSDAIRTILAAFIAAENDGVHYPIEKSIHSALMTTIRTRRKMAVDKVRWRKAIIWVPKRMHALIEDICAAQGQHIDQKLRVADFIRGAAIYASELDPYGNIAMVDDGDAVTA